MSTSCRAPGQAPHECECDQPEEPLDKVRGMTCRVGAGTARQSVDRMTSMPTGDSARPRGDGRLRVFEGKMARVSKPVIDYALNDGLGFQLRVGELSKFVDKVPRDSRDRKE